MASGAGALVSLEWIGGRMATVLPNIRKLFIPDPKHMIFEADLAGADAQVVAAEADDKDLLAAFKAGLDVHSKNAADMIGEEFNKLEPPARKKQRQKFKQFCHGTNYVAGKRTLAVTLAWSEAEVRQRQAKWFMLHPGIKQWHKDVEARLAKDRTIYNKFGYRIIYFDRMSGLLPQALAWIPQSTVALVTRKAALQLPRVLPETQLLLQVHDSIVFQLPFALADKLDRIQEGLRIAVPYPDPLVIPWTIKRSEKSWGDCEDV